MKDCCKTGDEKPKNKTGKILTWLIYAVVIGLLVFIVINQINSKP